jgi:diguanylate cyclase (GGDEF)-like protein/PAS domain S-box-containing protein
MRLQTKVLTFSILIFLVLGLSILALTKRVVHTILVNEVGKRGLLKTEDLPLSTALGFQSGDDHALIPVLQKGLERTGAVYAIARNLDGRILAHATLVDEGKRFQESVIRQVEAFNQPGVRQIVADGRKILDVSLPVLAIRHSSSEEEFLLIGGKALTEQQILGTFHVGIPLTELLATENEILNQVLWIILLTGGSALGLSLFSIREILNRIRSLVEGTERVSRGEYTHIIPAHSSTDELGELALSFNKMTARLARRDEMILSSAGEGILGLDLEGKATFVNPAAARMLGYSVDELIGQSMHDLLHHAKTESANDLKENFFSDHCAIYATVAEGKAQHATDEVLWRKDGTNFPVEYVSTPLRENEKVAGSVIVIKDITERKAHAAVLEYRANHDTLTNLPNRTFLSHHLSEAITRAFWHKRVVAVLFLDLDNFKKINDTLGHDFGDLLLIQVGERLTGCLRDGDTVSRLGGDEFVLVLADVAKISDVSMVAQKVLDALSKPFELNRTELFITTSIGISAFPSDGETAEILLKNADTAMYRAKEKGKNQFEMFSASMSSRFHERLALETDLHRAIERGDFLLHYQPQVDLKTGEVIATEALLRWKRNGLKMTNPLDFIPLAEETGLIISIGEWVLRTAARQNRAWQDSGISPIRVAINLSARQFQQNNLLKMIHQVLNETGLKPHFLELELTESILMQNERETIDLLTGLHETGVRLSIDDFGTGFSSLSYLQRFPINALKIDKSFIQDIPMNPGNGAIVKSIITLGHSLQLKVIAEGVETKEQLEFLRANHCDEIQGYLFSRPLPADDATQFLIEKRNLSVNLFN